MYDIVLKYETIRFLYFMVPVTDEQNVLMGVMMKLLT